MAQLRNYLEPQEFSQQDVSDYQPPAENQPGADPSGGFLDNLLQMGADPAEFGAKMDIKAAKGLGSLIGKLF
jgi:hypothetical protein